MDNLADLTPEELEAYFLSLGQPKFRGRQAFSWIAKGVTDFRQMTNFPKALQERLSEIATPLGAKIFEKYESSIDETVKYLIQLEDGNLIETVLMSYHHGYTVCLSTEVGCAMGCAFCASTLGGLVRRLTPGEILAQAALVSADSGHRISNIVLMGIGEPMDNYENVVKFIRLANRPEGLNIGQRHISLSTCGWVDGIDRLSEEHLGITLCVSLHAAFNEKRTAMMPINKKYPIEPLLEACRRYTEKTGRRMIFEYALIKGVNDSKKDAEQLSGLLRGILCHVNLIPVNPIQETGFEKSECGEQFCRWLEPVTATVRRELGSDIQASCGQLRRRKLKEEGRED